MGKKHLCI